MANPSLLLFLDSAAAGEAAPTAADLVEQANYAIGTMNRQLLGRCVQQAGRLEDGGSWNKDLVNAAKLHEDMDDAFGELETARRSRDPGRLKQAVQALKDSGFMPFVKDELFKAEELEEEEDEEEEDEEEEEEEKEKEKEVLPPLWRYMRARFF